MKGHGPLDVRTRTTAAEFCPRHMMVTYVRGHFKDVRGSIPDTIRINRVIGFGYIDPLRAGPPKRVGRQRLPLTELAHWETW